MFEDLYGASSAELFVRQLREAALNCYGSPLRSYLRLLVEDQSLAVRIIRSARESVGQTMPSEAAGEVRRAADRFALIAAAGELATQWGLTGWQAGESIEAANRCFTEWIDGRGTLGNSDVEAGIRQVRAFIGAHGTSPSIA